MLEAGLKGGQELAGRPIGVSRYVVANQIGSGKDDFSRAMDANLCTAEKNKFTIYRHCNRIRGAEWTVVAAPSEIDGCSLRQQEEPFDDMLRYIAFGKGVAGVQPADVQSRHGR